MRIEKKYKVVFFRDKLTQVWPSQNMTVHFLISRIHSLLSLELSIDRTLWLPMTIVSDNSAFSHGFLYFVLSMEIFCILEWLML